LEIFRILISNDIAHLTKKVGKEVQTTDETNILGEYIRKRIGAQLK
jgi:hypothetical protein